MVCAGDVLSKGIFPSVRWPTQHIAPIVPVVFAAGNHEFYHSSIHECLRQVREASAHPNLHFLENDVVKIGDVAFVGGTLWSDFRLFGRDPQVAMSYARSGMNDYKRIKLSKTPFLKFKPIDAFRKHIETRDFIACELRKRRGQKSVVVTHHAPSHVRLPAGFVTIRLRLATPRIWKTSFVRQGPPCGCTATFIIETITSLAQQG
ncbi:metallophosphoesterase [Neorhizobium sp. P12A]|uniref:metallophosphoesterase n=1 Tax=Neorhizobium sp. P12A TaxID=2268027 RepID=UPI0032B23F0A